MYVQFFIYLWREYTSRDHKKYMIVTHMHTLTVQAVMIFNPIKQTKFENHSLAFIKQLLPLRILSISPFKMARTST